MLWRCMSSVVVGRFIFIKRIVDSKLYCDILQERMLKSIKKLGRHLMLKHDNDSKYTSKMTTKSFIMQKGKGIALVYHIPRLPWSTMSRDFKPIEDLWGVLKRKVDVKNLQCNIVGRHHIGWVEVNLIGYMQSLVDPICPEDLIWSIKAREITSNTQYSK